MMRLSLTLVLLAFVGSVSATTDPGSEKPTLAQQFEAVREQAEVIESFRMLKAYQVENFWKAVQDTLRQKDASLAEIKERMAASEGEIESLKSTMQQKEAAVSEMEFAGTHITVLGMDVTKAGFVRTVFLGGGALVVLIGLGLWAFRLSYRTASESRSLYDEVCREFETYKHRVVEKEVKLLRELQDHRNRLMEKELKSA
jgi:uncharacterized small protein (DUF1192 family)